MPPPISASRFGYDGFSRQPGRLQHLQALSLPAFQHRLIRAGLKQEIAEVVIAARQDSIVAVHRRNRFLMRRSIGDSALVVGNLLLDQPGRRIGEPAPHVCCLTRIGAISFSRIAICDLVSITSGYSSLYCGSERDQLCLERRQRRIGRVCFWRIATLPHPTRRSCWRPAQFVRPAFAAPATP